MGSHVTIIVCVVRAWHPGTFCPKVCELINKIELFWLKHWSSFDLLFSVIAGGRFLRLIVRESARSKHSFRVVGKLPRYLTFPKVTPPNLLSIQLLAMVHSFVSLYWPVKFDSLSTSGFPWMGRTRGCMALMVLLTRPVVRWE